MNARKLLDKMTVSRIDPVPKVSFSGANRAQAGFVIMHPLTGITFHITRNAECLMKLQTR